MRLRNGRRIRAARAVVSNASSFDTLHLLAPGTAPEQWGAAVEATPLNPSFMHLHLGFDATGLEGLELHHISVRDWDLPGGVTAPQNVVLISIASGERVQRWQRGMAAWHVCGVEATGVLAWGTLDVRCRSNAGAPSCTFCRPSCTYPASKPSLAPAVIDPSLAPPGKHCLHAYTPATEPWELWEGLDRRSEEYTRLKEERSQVLWDGASAAGRRAAVGGQRLMGGRREAEEGQVQCSAVRRKDASSFGAGAASQPAVCAFSAYACSPVTHLAPPPSLCAQPCARSFLTSIRASRCRWWARR